MNGKKITTVLGMVLLTSITCVGAAFHPGDRGTQITEIQQALVKQGMHLAVDGDYGADTQEAIRTFQKKTRYICRRSDGGQDLCRIDEEKYAGK